MHKHLTDLIENFDTVGLRDGDECVALFIGKFPRLVSTGSKGWIGLSVYDENLYAHNHFQEKRIMGADIMIIKDMKGNVKWTRDNRPDIEIEKDAIRSEMEKLAKRLDELEVK